MDDSPDPVSYDDIGPGSAEPATGAPRWAKVFAIIGLVLVVLFVVLLLVGGGNHGPGRHSSSGAAVGPPPTAGSVVEPGRAEDHARRRGGHGADAQ